MFFPLFFMPIDRSRASHRSSRTEACDLKRIKKRTIITRKQGKINNDICDDYRIYNDDIADSISFFFKLP